MLLLSGDVELQALYKEGGASHAVPGCANQGAKVIGLPRQHAARCCRWSEGLQYSLPGYWEPTCSCVFRRVDERELGLTPCDACGVMSSRGVLN